MSIQVLSAQEFRQKLAGLVNPELVLPEEDREEVKQAAINFITILASLFGEDLDRKTLWERIGNGIKVCSAKCGGDWEAFINQILDYIKADGGRVAASRNLDSVIQGIEEKPTVWKESFLRILETKHFLIVIKARALWNSSKRASKECDIEERFVADGFMDEVPVAL